jgi:hypothetical protein
MGAYGNTQQASKQKDTVNPTVLSITPGDTLLADDDVGDASFTVEVQFSEAMNSLVAPTIDFTPMVSSTLTWASGAWSAGNTTYTAFYTWRMQMRTYPA